MDLRGIPKLPNSELIEVTTEELLDELERRSEYMVFSAVLKVDQRQEDVACSRHRFRGGFYACVGLAYELLAGLKDQLNQTAE